MMSTETQAAFEAIVLGGMKKPLGMPSFADALDRTSTAAIQAFISSKAYDAREAQSAKRAAEQADVAEENAAPRG